MHVAKTIDAPADIVWRILIDSERWPQWGPSVVEVDYFQRWIEAGAIGRIKTVLGFWLPFEVTVFEPREYWHWNVAGVPATGHRITALSANQSQLSFEFPSLIFPYGVVCKKALVNIDLLAKKELTP